MRGADGVTVVYDDSGDAPPDVMSMTGVTRFGDLLRRRERLSTTLRRLTGEAGMSGFVHVRSADDLLELEERIRRRPADGLYLLLPSSLAPTADRDASVLFLRKLRLLTHPVALHRGGVPAGACLLDGDGLVAYAEEARAAEGQAKRRLRALSAGLPQVEDALRLADLTDLATALEFLSGSFSARHFNHVEQDRYYVVKRSRDRDKIRREYRFFGLLPEAIQPFFLQPFDFREDDQGASYRTRRLFVPDLAVQWVHQAITGQQFEQLLAHLLHFIEVRPRRHVGREEARRVARSLYVDKVQSRVDALLDVPEGRAVDATLVAGGLEGGVRGLLGEYLALHDRITRRRRDEELTVSHGDPCFSNVLYSPATQLFQLIDPRGADDEQDVYSDAFYDVAKLSHSVLGGYDFVVAGLFDLVHGDDLALGLRVEDEPLAAQKDRFRAALEAHGFDLTLVRLYEASLFLSMLPLHIEAPKRVTAFALRARDILRELR